LPQGKGGCSKRGPECRVLGGSENDRHRDKTKASDEALIVLMNFYLGEATSEDVLHHVTVRGKRMLPLLLKYRDARLIFPKKDYASILLPADVRREDFDSAIKSIEARKTLGED
jgi:hypothetical protein